jgi:chitodextrinase
MAALVTALVALTLVVAGGRAATSDAAIMGAPTAPPLSQFGYSNGTVSDMAPSDMAVQLNAIASIAGKGGIVRAPLHWDPYQAAGPSWTKYDSFVTQVTQRGLTWLPEVHESHNGHYTLPGSSPGGYTDWQQAITQVVQHYGPGGTYQAAHPGFPGITRFEVWNEPNTPTGNANPSCSTCEMAPATYDTILRYGSSALRAQAARQGFAVDVVGGVIGSIDLPYIQSLYKANTAFFSYMNTLSFHLYMSLDPASCGVSNPHCELMIPQLRSWMNANGGSAVHLGISEGGYSGSNDSNRPTAKVVSMAQQSAWGAQVVNYFENNPQLGMEFYCPFNPVDDGVKYNGSNIYYYWVDHLGAAYGNGTLKPWGVTYRNLIAANSHQQPPPPPPTPSVPGGLTDLTVPGQAPSFTWTASTEPGGQVTGYLVFRNGAQVATTSATSFTDTAAPVGQAETYTVEARDAAGVTSAASAPITITYRDTVAPSAPAGLVQTSVDGAIPSFSWTVSTDNVGVAGYLVYRNGVQIGQTAGTAYTDIGAVSGSTYTYTVAAQDAAGNVSPVSDSLEIGFVDTSPPTAPTALTAPSPTTGAPNLSWTAATDNVRVSGYRVYRDGVLVGTTTGTSFTDSSAPGPNPAVAHDLFERTQSPGWGTAPSGGAWTYSSKQGAGFWTNGVTGNAQVTRAGAALEAMLPESSVLSTDEVAGFSLSKVPVGDSVRVMVVGRSVGTAQYRGSVEVTPAGQMMLSARRVINGTAAAIGTQVVTSLHFAPQADYLVRMQLAGTSPTQIRLRVWQVGTSEPGGWAYTATDSTAVLQHGGAAGLRIASGRKLANAPMTALFESFQLANLAPTVSYTYTVQATDAAGNLSALSLPRTVTLN